MVAGRWFQLFKDVHRESQLMVAGRWFQLFKDVQRGSLN